VEAGLLVFLNLKAAGKHCEKTSHDSHFHDDSTLRMQ
jgi:hypothetical protein